MKYSVPVCFLSLLILVSGCSIDTLKQGMYEGAVEHQRLQDYPSNSLDEPPSYPQYQDELKQRSAGE